MTRKIGLSPTPPKNEARQGQIRTRKPKKGNRADAARRRITKKREADALQSLADSAAHVYENVEKAIDTHASSVVVSLPAPNPAHNLGGSAMTLTLKALTKNGKQAIYTGLRTAVRIAIVSFIGETAPETLDITGDVLGPKAKKVRLTKEERAALPKPTEAERIARAEANLAKRKAKLAADQM